MSISADDAMLARIAEPIGREAPCGRDLREETGADALYPAIRDARSAARAHERSLDDDPQRATGVPEEWRRVETLAVEALVSRTKDIELASWLVEALTRRAGLSGLALGARVIACLVTEFWTRGLYPALEADDPEARTFAVSGLSGMDRDGSLIQPIRKIVLFEMADGRPVTLWEYERARSRAASLAQGEHVPRIADELPSLDQMEAIARGPGQASLAATGRAAEDACAAWSALEAGFAEACRSCEPPAAAPSTSRVGRLLEDIRTAALRYVPRSEPPAAIPGEEDISPSEEIRAESAATWKRGTRGELLDDALDIAMRFRAMEPHSPFSYTLENAVRRARLPLPELLREVVADEASRAEILIRLGIQEQET
ncbi:type VI secretion system protein TssA [Acidomonas methanolica]|uniref:Secretion system type VI secretion-associated protein ImpA n=1 Tax=Acidomonas methanolica NBRC 104435 TaxID=1231351 RepID=A0A023D7D9_ACIMT|nr:type VI secretion system protein TssA [Acidomonas methanolica]MBU2652768.1 type VI secretion system protein TssA [Acidomonas methanolica]TCS31171.1 type VI secretion system protein ImpA [Acidomonas methanolica]GAJ30078.1 secretion system type VI secretion-associated protein ImpA [Acidomonas methanolica NBRC 104435]GBQ51134.1 ImpA domain-containing protein [Acidomonas methanolica]GEK98581.1 type VI secretion protein [Acidomonas methanolica NBRC 104435]